MRMVKRLISVFLLGVIAFFALINADRFSRPALKHEFFVSQTPETHYFINDIVGVSPAQSSLPNAYLLSHSARAAVLLADKGSYQLVAADNYGLSQDPNIAGWGALSEHVSGNGVLSLYYYRTFIVGVYRQQEVGQSERTLQVNIPWPAIYGVEGGVNVLPVELDNKARFKVTFNGAGSFWIETQPPPSDGFSIEFLLNGFLPGEVLVGADQRVVDENRFTLATKDLHSLAVTETNGINGAEISVVRGGIRGKLGAVDPAARDLLVDSITGVSVAERYPDFLKKGCPGRQSSWIDVDSDGDLDFYISCGRPSEPTALFPNQLFINMGDNFVESGEDFDLNFEAYGSFRFIDWDGDLDPDLWWASADGVLQYYENRDNHFVLNGTFSGSWQGNHRSPQLLVYDLTDNGSPDLLVTHPSGNRLLLNQNGNVEVKNVSELGLPEKTLVAHLADINLDGLVDLLTATQGVFVNQGELDFVRREGEIVADAFVYDARLVSFADIGGRQFLLGLRSCLPGKLCGGRRVALGFLRKYLPLSLGSLETLGLIEPYDWSIQVLQRKAKSVTHKEVAITLQGTKYNPMALGGRVDLEWGKRKQSHWVAESESSLYSQADMSMYFSLPVLQLVRGHAVWPDGCTSTFTLPANVSAKEIKRPLRCLLGDFMASQ